MTLPNESDPRTGNAGPLGKHADDTADFPTLVDGSKEESHRRVVELPVIAGGLPHTDRAMKCRPTGGMRGG